MTAKYTFSCQQWPLLCLPSSREIIAAITRGSLCFLSEAEYAAKYSGERPLLSLTVQQPGDVPIIRHKVDELLRKKVPHWQGLARKKALVALSEAITNVVLHTPGGRVLVYLDACGPSFHVQDQGPGLKLGRRPHLLFARGFSTTGSLGAGFHLMINCLDRLVVSTSEQGTKLVLYPAGLGVEQCV